MLSHLLISFFYIIYSFVPYAYASIESIDCIILSLLVYNPILLIHYVFFSKYLCFSLLNLYFGFNINSFFFMIFWWFSGRLSTLVYFLLAGLLYFQVKMPLNSVYNLYI